MPNFTHTGKKNPGDRLVTNGGAAAVQPNDTLTVHGYRVTVAEALRRGLVRTVSVAGNTTTFALEQNGDKFNQ